MCCFMGRNFLLSGLITTDSQILKSTDEVTVCPSEEVNKIMKRICLASASLFLNV